MSTKPDGKFAVIQIFLFVAFLIFPVCSLSAEPASSDEELKRRLEILCRKLDEQRIKEHIPGIAIAVVQDDEVILARGFGLRDVKKKLPVEAETLFAVGSTTKAFTSTLACMLSEDGKLTLDDPVRKHVKDFKLKDERADEMVALRDLMCHRTGLSRMGMLWAGGTLTEKEVLGYVTEAEPYRPFRTAFLYNNIMYLVAGMALGEAGGKNWHQLIKARIFEPLSMNHSNTSVEVTKSLASASKGYSWNEVDKIWDREDMRDLSMAAPAGAINSNVLDMARWIRFQLGRGMIEGERHLEEKYFDEMWKLHTPMAPNVAYGLGWMLRDWNGKKVVEHGGNIDGFAAQVGLLPEENLGFCFLANVSVTPLQQGSLDLVWSTLLGELDTFEASEEDSNDGQQAMSAQELGRYVGKYHFSQMQADLTVVIKEGQLAVDVPGQTVYVLKWPTEEGRWVFELTNEIEVSFDLPEGAEEAVSMTMYQSGMTFNMLRTKIDGDLPSVEDVLVLRKKAGLVEEGDGNENCRMKGTAHFVHQGVKGSFEVIMSGERFVRKMDLGKIGDVTILYDGKKGFEQSFKEDPKEVTGKELLALKHERLSSVFGDWRKHWEKVEVSGKREFQERETYIVQLIDEVGDTNDIFVDVESGRILGRQFVAYQNGISAPMISRYEYGDDAAAHVPLRTITDLPQSGDLIIEISSYETGLPPFEDSFFVLKTM